MAVINKVNERIAKFADGKKIRYLNINDKLADKEGKLLEGMSPDALHLSAKGYQVWADALKPLFTELLGRRRRLTSPHHPRAIPVRLATQDPVQATHCRRRLPKHARSTRHQEDAQGAEGFQGHLQ